jgi:hypothetical protein
MDEPQQGKYNGVKRESILAEQMCRIHDRVVARSSCTTHPLAGTLIPRSEQWLPIWVSNALAKVKFLPKPKGVIIQTLTWIIWQQLQIQIENSEAFCGQSNVPSSLYAE